MRKGKRSRTGQKVADLNDVAERPWCFGLHYDLADLACQVCPEAPRCASLYGTTYHDMESCSHEVINMMK